MSLPSASRTFNESQKWLRGHRLGDGGKDGGAGVYLLSRQQLQKWWYVDKMTPTELQEKYRVECGVYADRAHLVKWVQVHMQDCFVGMCRMCLRSFCRSRYLLLIYIHIMFFSFVYS